ncbi:hypothetical protein MRB53_028335 [Persea americana]|uniref:Uncharacterized protein n=1 Tax=Persea americana TaxID=3435 RepID=A0ACC2KFK9_PERAE|nr:hypothetical protein MRB53_028335 [Persea americana]
MAASQAATIFLHRFCPATPYFLPCPRLFLPHPCLRSLLHLRQRPLLLFPLPGHRPAVAATTPLQRPPPCTVRPVTLLLLPVTPCHLPQNEN